MKVTLEDIQSAEKRLKDVVRHTQMEKSVTASKMFGSDIFFKFENEQITGSFKLRGAYNCIAQLSQDEKKRGVVASSAGNHAQGVAYSATMAGVPSTIVMPIHASLVKVAATREYGANVVLHGEIYDEAYEHARTLEKQKNLTFVHPYENEKVIAGQGTIGLEMLATVPDLDSVIIPIGGGGLISGIATAIKALHPKCKIYGVQSDQAPGMEKLFHHHPPATSRKKIATIADGIAIKNPSPVMYESFISKLVDDIVTVTDDEIAEAIFFLMEKAKTVTEGSGAAAAAALLHRSQLKLGKKSCVLLCGGNIDLNIVSKVIEKGQIRRGRLVEMSVVVEDLPGALHRMTEIIAAHQANILEVHHDRVSHGLFLRETRIDFLLETSSHEHIEKIRQALLQSGVRFLSSSSGD